MGDGRWELGVGSWEHSALRFPIGGPFGSHFCIPFSTITLQLVFGSQPIRLAP
jgi:hypothetical protein